MANYQPIKIAGMQTGLVQDREEFILPNDAYPVLQNAFVWRERIKRKSGCEFVGRLRRVITAFSSGTFNFTAGVNTFNLFSYIGVNVSQPNAQLEPGNISNITINFSAPIAQSLIDTAGTGVLNVTGAGPLISGTINYSTGVVTFSLTGNRNGVTVTVSFSYYPSLPVMGCLTRELNLIDDEQTVFFDTIYAYVYSAPFFVEFIPGTTWKGTDLDFFWSTNYWNAPDASFMGPTPNGKIFWVTNFNQTSGGGDPIRYTEGTVWVNFSPIIDNLGNMLQQCLALLPFRGRLVAFNTIEGVTLSSGIQFFQRIRWSAIGNPVSDVSTIFPVGSVNANAWNANIRGQGGFLDIPTSQNIVSVGFVRDNLVVYCERSTWQLRYTGRSIAPFQIEKVNSELGTESTFSAVQFDTSLVGIGDKGIVQCDSFKSERIDIKIPDLVFNFQNVNDGAERVYGIRDFQQRLAYWIYPFAPDENSSVNYPNRRLVYNYENDSWAIFQDSFTALGNFQLSSGLTWAQSTFPWSQANFQWVGKPGLFPFLVAGNQQGFIVILDQLVSNEETLFIQNIIGNVTTVTTLVSPDHNLETGQVIQLIDIISTDPFFDLNNQIFGVVFVDADTIQLWELGQDNLAFDEPNLHASGTYISVGKIRVRDGFSVKSKKFNFLDEGQNIQLGFIDVLLNNTAIDPITNKGGAITLNVYVDYNDANPVNTTPYNNSSSTNLPDAFFNTIIPTTVTINRGSTKNWQRVFCPTRGAFITTEFTLSNAQLVGIEQTSEVQIDCQIMWVRSAGRYLPIGI